MEVFFLCRHAGSYVLGATNQASRTPGFSYMLVLRQGIPNDAKAEMKGQGSEYQALGGYIHLGLYDM